MLRGIGGERAFLDRYRMRSQQVRRAGVRVALPQSTLDAAQVLLPGLFVVFVTWLSARFALSGQDRNRRPRRVLRLRGVPRHPAPHRRGGGRQDHPLPRRRAPYGGRPRRREARGGARRSCRRASCRRGARGPAVGARRRAGPPHLHRLVEPPTRPPRSPTASAGSATTAASRSAACRSRSSRSTRFVAASS